MSYENLPFDEILKTTLLVEAINMIDEAAKVGSFENDIIFPSNPVTSDGINDDLECGHWVYFTPPLAAYSKSRLAEIIWMRKDDEEFRALIIARLKEHLDSGHFLLTDVIDYISQFEDPRLSLPFTRMVEETEGRFEL